MTRTLPTAPTDQVIANQPCHTIVTRYGDRLDVYESVQSWNDDLPAFLAEHPHTLISEELITDPAMRAGAAYRRAYRIA